MYSVAKAVGCDISLWNIVNDGGNYRFDLDEPGTLEAGPHSGLLRDLGAHLVDQALWLPREDQLPVDPAADPQRLCLDGRSLLDLANWDLRLADTSYA